LFARSETAVPVTTNSKLEDLPVQSIARPTNANATCVPDTIDVTASQAISNGAESIPSPETKPTKSSPEIPSKHLSL